MTALRGYIPAGGAVGAHSLDHFTLQVPDLAVAAPCARALVYRPLVPTRGDFATHNICLSCFRLIA